MTTFKHLVHYTKKLEKLKTNPEMGPALRVLLSGGVARPVLDHHINGGVFDSGGGGFSSKRGYDRGEKDLHLRGAKLPVISLPFQLRSESADVILERPFLKSATAPVAQGDAPFSSENSNSQHLRDPWGAGKKLDPL